MKVKDTGLKCNFVENIKMMALENVKIVDVMETKIKLLLSLWSVCLFIVMKKTNKCLHFLFWRHSKRAGVAKLFFIFYYVKVSGHK